MDAHSHKLPYNQAEDSVCDEEFKVHPIIDEGDGASIDKADKSSISDHYSINSRRRIVSSSQRVATTNQPMDTISSM